MAQAMSRPRSKRAQDASAQQEQRCIVILGMHRSGTSALARTISLMGAALPARVLGAARGNATGHWEPVELGAFNDRLLSRVGGRWDDWRRVDVSAVSDAEQDELKQELQRILREDYGAAPLCVLKEPRSCRLVDMLDEALTAAGMAPAYVLMTRSPAEVCESLHRRDGIAREYAAMMWLRHVLDAEKKTRSHKRMVLAYDALLQDWRAACARMSRELSIDFPVREAEAAAEIEAFLRADLRHHKANELGFGADDALADLVGRTHASLEALALDAADAAALASLDRLDAEFDAFTAGLPPLIEAEAIHRERRLLARADKREHGLLDELGRATAALEERRVEAVEARRVIDGLVAESAAASAALEMREKEMAKARAVIDEADAAKAELSAALKLRTAEAAAAQDHIDELGADREGMRALLEQREAEASNARSVIAELEAEVSNARSVIAELEAERNTYRADMVSLRLAIRGITSTRLWRWSAPLRDLLSRLSPTRKL